MADAVTFENKFENHVIHTHSEDTSTLSLPHSDTNVSKYNFEIVPVALFGVPDECDDIHAAICVYNEYKVYVYTAELIQALVHCSWNVKVDKLKLRKKEIFLGNVAKRPVGTKLRELRHFLKKNSQSAIEVLVNLSDAVRQCRYNVRVSTRLDYDTESDDSDDNTFSGTEQYQVGHHMHAALDDVVRSMYNDEHDEHGRIIMAEFIEEYLVSALLAPSRHDLELFQHFEADCHTQPTILYNVAIMQQCHDSTNHLRRVILECLRRRIHSRDEFKAIGLDEWHQVMLTYEHALGEICPEFMTRQIHKLNLLHEKLTTTVNRSSFRIVSSIPFPTGIHMPNIDLASCVRVPTDDWIDQTTLFAVGNDSFKYKRLCETIYSIVVSKMEEARTCDDFATFSEFLYTWVNALMARKKNIGRFVNAICAAFNEYETELYRFFSRFCDFSLTEVKIILQNVASVDFELHRRGCQTDTYATMQKIEVCATMRYLSRVSYLQHSPEDIVYLISSYLA